MYNSQELKEKLPYGFQKKVAEKAGVGQQSVSKFLNGKTKSWKVEKAVREVIADLDQQRAAILNSVYSSATNE